MSTKSNAKASPKAEATKKSAKETKTAAKSESVKAAPAKALPTPAEIVKKAINEHRNDFLKMCKSIYDNPEVAFTEREAVATQRALLEELGAKVTTPFCNLETAYKASWGSSGPVFVFIAEYDALPDIGHACGHNLIATNAIAAAYATKCYLEQTQTPGIVTVMGCPAEEGKGGKILMIRERGFFRCDAAIIAHPADISHTDDGMLSNRRFNVIFHGIPSHAATAPELGRNALDGVTLVFMGVNAWRQHLPESSRVHGIITDGGKIPNIVPDYATCRFYLRAETDNYAKEMEKRFKDIVKGAALISGTKYRIQDEDTSYRPTRLNKALNDAYAEAAAHHGLDVRDIGHNGRGSSDFGNLSQVLPGAYVTFKICNEGTPWHSNEFKAAAGTDYAFHQAMAAAEAMAEVGIKFFTDAEFRSAVKADFDAGE